MDDDNKKKKAKGTTKCVIKCSIMFDDYKDCLFNNKTILKSQQRFNSDHDNVYTIEINKIALSSNDDRRLQTFDRVTTYPYGASAVKVCESEMMVVRGLFVEKFVDWPVLWWNSIKTIKISVSPRVND